MISKSRPASKGCRGSKIIKKKKRKKVQKKKKGNQFWNLLLIKLSSAWHFQKNEEKKGIKIQKVGRRESFFPWFVTLSITCVHPLLKHLHSYCSNPQFVHFPLK